MKDVKDFQERYNRWKNGERYWDIRGVDLPKYDTGKYITVRRDDGSVYNVNPNVANSSEITVTTPEIEVVAQKPFYLKKREQVLNNIIYNPGEIRQGEEPSALDNVRTFLSNYRDNPIAGNVEQAIEDWQHHKTPMQAAFDNFAYINPYTAAIAAGSNLLSDHGISRTVNLAKNGQYGSAALSGLGDLLDISMLSYGGRHIKNNGMLDAAKLFENTRFGDYLQNKIISNELNRNIANWKGINKTFPYKRIEIPQKQGNGRYQFDSPTYQIYIGPKHNISEIINTDGSVNLRNLLNIQNEALQNIPGGTIARHRLENTKWHPTDWNTFLHTRDAYKRALDNNYPQEALFPTLMHDFGKMWAGDGHGPYGASIIRQIFPKASNEQIQAIYEHMDSSPQNYISKLVKGADIKEPNQFRTDGLYEYLLSNDRQKLPNFVQNYFKQKAKHGILNVYHSTDHGPFTVFKPTKGHMGGLIEPFFHFGDINTKKFFEKFPEYTTRRFNIKGSNFLNVDDFTHSTPSQLINELYKRGYITRDKLSSLRDKMYDKRYFDRPDLFAQDILTELNSDGIHYINKVEGVGSNAYGVTNPNYIKLADPIVYDDFGKIIPLSQRFNFTNPDIRYNHGKIAYEKEK